MKKITVIASLAAALLTGFQGIAQTAEWSVDKAHSKVSFNITHLMVSEIEGGFKSFSAKITTKGADFTNASVEMTADVTSINTDNDKRDEHLKSADFFDVAKFPSLSFKSKSFKKAKGDNYTVTGDLTMHGVTKPVTLNVVAKKGMNPMSKKEVAGFKITGKVKRSDFGIGASMPDAMLSEEVAINANAEFSKD